jgi:hypothetical protein
MSRKKKKKRREWVRWGEEIIFSHTWLENGEVCRDLTVSLRKAGKSQTLMIWEQASYIFSLARIPLDVEIPDFGAMPHREVVDLFEDGGGCIAPGLAEHLKAEILFEVEGSYDFEWRKKAGKKELCAVGYAE